ncbi:ATP-binding cassette domain-containing protein [Streptomyces olivaceus]|uniref:ATP-binding cassette domain-containing protein n=1 Tax=Streptomyces olivaceus TaxID=47716 RepID=UPI001CCDFEE9|nr:ATP-binding cassette domain-containing protein [Streptomyces olivaceus]MBZ6176622.1 ATP-binding cassette domain-containing protein [Streptomyces olivaceus]MBZ6182880.1 ATP-binding cassette domain-containing protein [Streptomyces olivaceus]
MIEVRELTKRYGKVRAVDGLSFRVEPGRVTGFLGPNGAGKSTAIRAMVGLDRPTSGEVLVDGKRYEDLPRPLTTVGALLDARAVHGGRSVRGHLAGLARSNRLPARRVDELLETVGLASVADKRAKGLSLGMSQRLGIAGALLGDPQTLLLDEPVNGLDPEGVKWVRDLVKRVAGEGRAVLISSHLMSEMALTADHLIVIGRGRLLADTPAHDFITGNSRSYVLIRTPEPERMRDLLAARGVQVDHGPDGSLEAVGTDQKTVGTLAAESRIALYEVTTTTASLEDAFMQFTADSVEYRAEQGAAR